jgi:hypothetical protein
MSQEYIGALALLIVSALRTFGIDIASDAIMGILTGVVALWIAIRRYQKGDITLAGARR